MIATVILIVCGAVALYILFGYPVLLKLLPYKPAAAVQRNPRFQPEVTVLMAVHNGEAFIRRKIESLLSLDYPREKVRILVISDGSTDATDAIVESFADQGVRGLRAPRGGKAAALNLGLQHATGEILFMTDVRQAIDPLALSHLVANLADPSVGVVSGELRILRPDRVGEQADMELYWRYELWVRALHSSIYSMFSATGCIYVIRRSLAASIAPDTLSDDVMIPLGAFFRGYRIILDSSALAFDYPTAEGGEFRRRLRTLAGVWQVYARKPELLGKCNPMRWHFLSHRFGRLVLPWTILAALAATPTLPPSPVRTLLAGGEILVALLALADRVVPKGFPLKRLSSAARTFVVMNAAALLSILVFFVRPETLWRPTRVKTENRM
jgi:cellulose synthase/poly-beta-1,6-N-acetylglucosamine synthase-like glycosyltransferase